MFTRLRRWLAGAPIQSLVPDKPPEAPTPDPDEPWVDIKGIVANDGRIELEADWNDAFIEFLQEQGFNGANDEVIMQQYITVMHRQLMNEGIGESFE